MGAKRSAKTARERSAAVSAARSYGRTSGSRRPRTARASASVRPSRTPAFKASAQRFTTTSRPPTVATRRIGTGRIGTGRTEGTRSLAGSGSASDPVEAVEPVVRRASFQELGRSTRGDGGSVGRTWVRRASLRCTRSVGHHGRFNDSTLDMAPLQTPPPADFSPHAHPKTRRPREPRDREPRRPPRWQHGATPLPPEDLDGPARVRRRRAGRRRSRLALDEPARARDGGHAALGGRAGEQDERTPAGAGDGLLGRELETSRRGHREAAPVGDDGRERRAAQREVDRPETDRVVGGIDEQRRRQEIGGHAIGRQQIGRDGHDGRARSTARSRCLDVVVPLDGLGRNRLETRNLFAGNQRAGIGPDLRPDPADPSADAARPRGQRASRERGEQSQRRRPRGAAPRASSPAQRGFRTRLGLSDPEPLVEEPAREPAEGVDARPSRENATRAPRLPCGSAPPPPPCVRNTAAASALAPGDRASRPRNTVARRARACSRSPWERVSRGMTK